MIVNRVDDKTIVVSIQGELFSEEIIFKCFYWYGANYSVSVDRSNGIYNVQLTALENQISDERFESLAGKIKTDLLDYKTRDIVYKETINIKQILIAKAFSTFDEFDATPKGDLEDPVGFKID